MRSLVEEVKGKSGENLAIYRIFPTDQSVRFLRERLAQDPEGWPVSAKFQSWGSFVEDGAAFPAYDPRSLNAELYLLYLKDPDEPVACATLMGKDMTRAFDPLLPAWVEALTPWRACVAEAPGHEDKGYAALVGEAVLRQAKKLGFKVVHLFISVQADGQVPSSWRGFPCELVWRGRYCDQIPLPNGLSRTTLPDQIVLAIPLENVPD